MTEAIQLAEPEHYNLLPLRHGQVPLPALANSFPPAGLGIRVLPGVVDLQPVLVGDLQVGDSEVTGPEAEVGWQYRLPLLHLNSLLFLLPLLLLLLLLLLLVPQVLLRWEDVPRLSVEAVVLQLHLVPGALLKVLGFLNCRHFRICNYIYNFAP